MNSPTLSLVVLTRNEERHIHDCLVSVREWADELLVVDAHSQDGTVDIAREMGAHIETRAWDNFPRQRNAALDLARGDWVFFIDADERGTLALGHEVRRRIEAEPGRLLASGDSAACAGYWVPRRNIIFGKEIRHTGWSPDYQPRLLRRGAAWFDPDRVVHELVVWNGTSGHLREPLLHYNYESLAQFRAKQTSYTHAEALIWYAEGKRAHGRSFVGQPLREFFRRYVSLQGWRDGAHGLLLSVLMAYYAGVRQKMLWDMGRQS
ncbi:MAG: glycosyltransferase family 2 protein [Chloroflexi bacterium]|nr:glycosyltransferase family 2 protein [Chloroflexota bacterium]